MRGALSVFLVGAIAVAGCATVDVTKTAKGFYPATRADDMEILMTRPNRDYVELATVSTTKWRPSETGKMHNALRAKTAPLGADAVIITGSGIVLGPYNSQWMWTTGVAVRYTDESKE
jgi:hypothetical protein